MLWTQIHVAFESIGHYVPPIQEQDEDNSYQMILEAWLARQDGQDLIPALAAIGVPDIHILAILASLIVAAPDAYLDIVLKGLGIYDRQCDSARAFVQLVHATHLLAISHLKHKSGKLT